MTLCFVNKTHECYTDGLVQDCFNSISSTLELLQSCTISYFSSYIPLLFGYLIFVPQIMTIWWDSFTTNWTVIVNTMATDDLAMQGARASAAMVLSMSFMTVFSETRKQKIMYYTWYFSSYFPLHLPGFIDLIFHICQDSSILFSTQFAGIH